MYQITSNGTTTISDTLRLIHLQKNGTYGLTTADKAEGFCAKIPTIVQDDVTGEDGEPTGEKVERETVMDTVFVLPGHTMKGTEPEGTYEEVQAVPVIRELETDLEDAYEMLYGGER